jgi:hypothetical protein
LFSSLFTNAAGPLDSFRTYVPWLHRAAGESSHIHPWCFYFHRLLFFHAYRGPVWTEAFILVLAVIGAGAGFIGSRQVRLGPLPGRERGRAVPTPLVKNRLDRADADFIRFLALYTLALTAAYSLIAYKTPWCLLSFWHGMVLLAGVGAAMLLRGLRQRVPQAAVCVLLLGGAGHLAWQAWQLSVPRSSDPANPYVYAHTSANLLELVDQVEALAQASPEGHQVLVKVVAPGNDFWPLPWYLRGFTQVVLLNDLPANPFAPIMIVSAKLEARLEQKPGWIMAGYYQLRPQVFFALYVQSDLWQAYLRKTPPKTDGS